MTMLNLKYSRRHLFFFCLPFFLIRLYGFQDSRYLELHDDGWQFRSAKVLGSSLRAPKVTETKPDEGVSLFEPSHGVCDSKASCRCVRAVLIIRFDA